MGVLRSTQSMAAEVEEMRAALRLGVGGPAWRRCGSALAAKRATATRVMCVTGGISFLGFTLEDRLAVETQGQFLPPLACLLDWSLARSRRPPRSLPCAGSAGSSLSLVE